MLQIPKVKVLKLKTLTFGILNQHISYTYYSVIYLLFNGLLLQDLFSLKSS